jgi:hypothetical protein
MPDVYTSNEAYRAHESSRSAVSWGAIFAGALTAWAVTLIIIIIGAALGFSAVSPYGNPNVSATGFQLATGVFTVVAAIVASGLGGYITGRLRTRWVDVHTDEVYFRDTAHGLLSWALASFFGATLIALSATAVATGTAANPANGATTTMNQTKTSYTSPAMAPSDATISGQNTETSRQSAGTAGQNAGMTANDQEAARKATVHVSLWVAVSLLAGAFSAAWMATSGGRLRDRAVPTV